MFEFSRAALSGVGHVSFIKHIEDEVYQKNTPFNMLSIVNIFAARTSAEPTSMLTLNENRC